MFEIKLGHVIDLIEHRQFSVDALRLKTEEGLIGSHVAGQFVKAHHRPTQTVYEEKRWIRARGLQRHQRRP